MTILPFYVYYATFRGAGDPTDTPVGERKVSFSSGDRIAAQHLFTNLPEPK